MPIRVLATLLLAAAAFSALPAFAQAIKGGLVGTVTDSSGAVVVSAQVRITEVRTGISRSVETNRSGVYVAPNLDAGSYRLTLEVPGFSKLVRENIDVLVNTTVRVDLELRPGSVNETVDVKDELAAIQTDRSDTGRKIAARQVADMPLAFNRNFQSLVNLVPGATRSERLQSEFYNPQDALATRVNGQSRLGNNVQLEGVDNNYRAGLLTVVIPSIEAIETVDITTSNYDAEFGRAGGAVTNVTLRSGTNQLHGSAFHLNRVSRLAARNVFSQDKAPITYNQYGFVIGGPIARNRTFFLGDFQGIKDRRGDTTRATIPTIPFRTGDLRGSQTIIYDPATGRPDGTGRQPFADFQIPAARISPISQRLLNLVPAPTFPGFSTNFERSTVRKKDTNSFDAKIDHQLRDQSRFSVRYSLQRPVTDQPPVFGNGGGPGVGGGYAGHGVFLSQSAAINYTEILSPTLIAEVRLGVSRYRNDARNFDFSTNASQQVGIPGVNIDAFSGGLTAITINGYSSPMLGTAGSMPLVRAETSLLAAGSITRVHGNHTIKAGGEIRRARDVFDNGAIGGYTGMRGTFTFNAGPTALNGDARTSFANSFAAFLLDAPTGAQREFRVVAPDILQTIVSSYVQDKWQVTPKLTLDIGLRHEIYLPPRPHSPGGISNYDPDTNSLRLAGIGSVPSNLGIETYWTGFAPRLGVAYRFNQKTVLRAGYGGSMVPLGGEPRAYLNFPVRQNVILTAANSFSPAGSLASGFPAPPPLIYPTDGIIRNPAAGQGFRYLAKDVKEGRIESWNVSLQRALPAAFSVEAAYVANHGSRFGVARDMNAAQIPGTGVASEPFNQKYGYRTPIIDNYFPTDTDYHSLQVKIDRRFSGGFLLTTAYTFSKAIDYSSDNGALFINTFPEMNRGRSDNDSTHVFVQSYIYELPFGKNKRWMQSGAGRWVLGGWQVNGIVTLQSGPPLNFTTSATPLNMPGNSNRPNLNGRPDIYGLVGPGQLWFDTSKFSAPPSATFGNVGRNILSGPGLVNLDFSAFRKFRLTERFGLEFRFESFNFTNTPHFNSPSAAFGGAGFGQITTALQDQRTIQFGLKVSF